MKLISRIAGILAPPQKSSLSGDPGGSLGYDSATGKLRYRDAVNSVDRELGSQRFSSETVPFVHVSRSVNPSIPGTGAATAISWTVERADTDSMFDPAANSGQRLVCVTAGVYDAALNVAFNSNATGMRMARIAHYNSAGVFQRMVAENELASAGSATFTQLSISGKVKMAAGDYLIAEVAQNSGVALDLISPSNVNATEFSAVWMGGPGNAVNQVGEYTAAYYRSGAWAPNSGAVTALPWTTKMHDTAGLWDSVNTTRLYAREAGVYEIEAQVGFGVNSTGVRNVIIAINGNSNTRMGDAVQQATSGDVTRINAVGVQYLNAGDYIEVYTYQNSGVALSLEVNSAVTHVSMTRKASGKQVIPRARAARTAAFNLPAGAWTKIPVDAVDLSMNNDGMWDAANNRFVVMTAGTYKLTAQLCVTGTYGAPGSSGTMAQVQVRVNNNMRAQMQSGASNTDPILNTSAEVDLNVGDTIELWGYQTASTGGARALILTDQNGNLNFLQATKIAPSSSGGSGSGGGHVIKDEGVALAQRTNLDFTGAGVTVTDDSANDRTKVDIPQILRTETVPHVQARRSTTGGFPTGGGNVAINFDVDEYDTDNIHDPVTNNSRFVAQTAGRYLCIGAVSLSGSAANNSWYTAIRVTRAVGGGVEYVALGPGASGPASEAQAVVTLAVGDYVELTISNSTGATLNVQGGALSGSATGFFMTWLGGSGNVVDQSGVSAAKYQRSTAHGAVVNGNFTGGALAWDSAGKQFDTDGMWDSANPTRLYARQPGLYMIVAQCHWPANATGVRELIVAKNGNTGNREIDAAVNNQGAVDFTQVVSGEALLAAGDYIEVYPWQNSGSNLTPVNGNLTRVHMIRVGSGKQVIPRAQLYNSVSPYFTLAAGSNAFVTFDSEHNDNDAIHDTVSNTTRLVARTAGSYVVSASLILNTAASGGKCEIGLRVTRTDASVVWLGFQDIATGSQSGHITGQVDLGVGDYVEVRLVNSSTGSQQLQGGVNGSKFSMVKIGQSGTGANNEPGFTNSGTDLQATNSGNVKSGGAFIGKAIGSFSAYRSSNLSVANTGGVILFDTELWDVSNWYDPTTGRFTPQVAGYYQIKSRVYILGIASGKQLSIWLRKNGTAYSTPPNKVLDRMTNQTAAATDIWATGEAIMYFNGSTDYIEIWAIQNDTVNRNVYGGVDAETHIEGLFIGTA